MFKRRGNTKLVLCAGQFLDSLHDGKDHLTLLAFLALDTPNARVVDTGQEQSSWHYARLAKASGAALGGVAPLEALSNLLRIFLGSQFTPPIQVTMSSIVVKTVDLGNVVGMLVVDEVPYLLTVLFIILTLFLVVHFGFDIEEGWSASTTCSLPSATLNATYC